MEGGCLPGCGSLGRRPEAPCRLPVALGCCPNLKPMTLLLLEDARVFQKISGISVNCVTATLISANLNQSAAHVEIPSETAGSLQPCGVGRA